MDAVYRECFYALRQDEINMPTDTVGPHTGLNINGCTVSNWNYLASDGTAKVLQTTNRYVNPNKKAPRPPYWEEPSASPYNLTGNAYALYQGYGHGGQALFFVVFILSRSRNYNTLPITYAGLTTLSQGPYDGYARDAEPGDIIFNATTHSAAVVVERYTRFINLRSTLVGLDVVDSNWSGFPRNAIDTVGCGSEIIGRHEYLASVLADNNWRKISGRGRWW
jgi:hypothetical protein